MLVKLNTRRHERRGFTLMEVLVVVAILLLLVGVGGIALMRNLENAKRDRARMDITTLSNACRTYWARYDEWPISLELLWNDGRGTPFIENQETLFDPWGNPYQYDPNGTNNGGLKPDIWSQAPDGTVIGNWQTSREGR